MRRIALLLSCLLPTSVWAQSTVITTASGQFSWTITGTLTNGSYANGDKWVVEGSAGAGVSITARTPSDVDGIAPHMHGCVINPAIAASLATTTNINTVLQSAITNGYDNRIPNNGAYSAAANVADSLPFSVPAGSSLVCAKSNVSGSTCSGERCYLAVGEILTVLASSPPANSFRPPWIGTTKTKGPDIVIADINYARLHDIAVPAGAPSLGVAQAAADYPYLIYSGGTQTWEKTIPFTNAGGAPGFGREIGWDAVNALVSLHLNYTDMQKESIAIHVIQQAIDIYGLQQVGMKWSSKGGFSLPMKSLLMVGASIVNDADMMNAAIAGRNNSPFPVWGHDREYKVITQTDINTQRTCQTLGVCTSYQQSQLGMAEHCREGEWFQLPANCSEAMNTSYRQMHPWRIAEALVIRLMSLQDEWANDAFFNYTSERIAGVDGILNEPNPLSFFDCANDGANSIPIWVCTLYNAHWASTVIDGSITPGGGGPVIPTVDVTSPVSGTETTSATVTVSGTATSAQGITSVTVNGEAATGTTSWSKAGVALTDQAVNTLLATAIGGDGGAGSDTVSVLRVTLPATCTFSFVLNSGGGATPSWPTLPTGVFSSQTSNVIQWQNNAATGSGTNGRHFSFCKDSIQDLGDDQFSEITLGFTPTGTNAFAYAGVEMQGTSDATYDNCTCTAQDGATIIAQIDNGVRVQRSTTPTTWVSGDRLRTSKSTQAISCLKNDVTVVTTASACTLTAGQPGFGVWGPPTVRVTAFTSGAVAGGDITAPLVSFVLPTAAATLVLPEGAPTTIDISGTASDAVGVSSCTYLNVQTAETGAATGTASWSKAGIVLGLGLNQLRLSCADAAGNIGTAELSVTYPEPDPEAPPESTSRVRFRIR